jgi:hypothetical protein
MLEDARVGGRAGCRGLVFRVRSQTFFCFPGCTPNHPFVNALPQRAVARACGPDTELSLCDHPAEGVRPNQGHVVPWSGQAAPESTSHLGLNLFAGVSRLSRIGDRPMQPTFANHGEVFSMLAPAVLGFINIPKNRSPSPFRLRRRLGLHPQLRPSDGEDGRGGPFCRARAEVAGHDESMASWRPAACHFRRGGPPAT